MIKTEFAVRNGLFADMANAFVAFIYGLQVNFADARSTNAGTSPLPQFVNFQRVVFAPLFRLCLLALAVGFIPLARQVEKLVTIQLVTILVIIGILCSLLFLPLTDLIRVSIVPAFMCCAALFRVVPLPLGKIFGVFLIVAARIKSALFPVRFLIGTRSFQYSRFVPLKILLLILMLLFFMGSTIRGVALLLIFRCSQIQLTGAPPFANLTLGTFTIFETFVGYKIGKWFPKMATVANLTVKGQGKLYNGIVHVVTSMWAMPGTFVASPGLLVPPLYHKWRYVNA